jgi:hypothetical protein
MEGYKEVFEVIYQEGLVGVLAGVPNALSFSVCQAYLHVLYRTGFGSDFREA